MARGFYYQPRDLTGLDEQALHRYAEICDRTIEAAERERLRLEAKLELLTPGRRTDKILAYGGLGLALVGIATVPLLSPLGFLALLGGGMSLKSADGTVARLQQRSRPNAEFEDRLASIAFCQSELARIRQRLAEISPR